jgi:hypothetical protein
VDSGDARICALAFEPPRASNSPLIRRDAMAKSREHEVSFASLAETRKKLSDPKSDLNPEMRDLLIRLVGVMEFDLLCREEPAASA